MIIFIILFCILTIIVSFDLSDDVDKNISRSISGQHGDPIFESMRYITKMGSFYFILPASITIIVLFYYLKETLLSILYAVMMLSVIPAYRITKYLLGRHRPEIDLIHETGYSYPSGHTVGAFTFFMGLYVFYQLLYKEENNYPFLIVCILFSSLVGLSRMVLGVHFLSDVIGGILLSGILITTFSIAYRKIRPKFKNNH